MRLLRLALCLAAPLFSGGAAIAAPGDAIGSAVTIVNLVTAQLEQDRRRLASGDDVRQQELIEVDTDGRGELILRDDTKLALGPGSRLLLDQFVYNPDISGGAIVLDLARGAFRFITGLAAKPAYVIRTPTASITVRGTIFDVYVELDGTAWLLLLNGAVEVCLINGLCQLHDEPGKLIRIAPDTLGKPTRWAALPGKQDVAFDTAFPFVVEAPGIAPDPIFTRDEIVLGTTPDTPPKYEDRRPKKKKDRGQKAEKRKPTKKAEASDRRKRKRRKAASVDEDKIVTGVGIAIGIGIGKKLWKGGGRGGRGGRGNRGR